MSKNVEIVLMRQLRSARKAEGAERKRRLWAVHHRARRESKPLIAALCLNDLAQMELDPIEELRLRRRAVAEHPSSFTWRMLASRAAAWGDFRTARNAYRAALSSAEREGNPRFKDDYAKGLREVEEALAGRSDQLDWLRVERECALARARATRDPRRALARIRRLRRLAIAQHDSKRAARYLQGIIDAYECQGKMGWALREARRLVAEQPSGANLELLGQLLEATGDLIAAIAAYARGAKLAQRQREEQVRIRLEWKTSALKSKAIAR